MSSLADIELKQIRHALAVAEQGSVARAATQLQTSPSSLSRSISSLEKQLGAQLFRRRSGTLEPTDLGRLFLERGRAMVGVADELDRLIGRNPSLHAGRLAIGIGATSSEVTTATVAAQMMTELPQLSFELRSALPNDLLPAMRLGEIDVLVTQDSLLAADGEYELQALAPMPLVVVVGPDHPLTRWPRFELQNIFQHPVYAGARIHPRLLNDLLQVQALADGPLARTRPMPAMVGNSTTLLTQLPRQSEAVTAMSPALARRHVEAGHLVALAAPRWMHNPYALVRPRSRARHPTAELFCQRYTAAHEAEVAEAHRLIEAWLPATPTERVSTESRPTPD